MMKGDSYDSVVAFVEDCLVKDKDGMYLATNVGNLFSDYCKGNDFSAFELRKYIDAIDIQYRRKR